jgi:hypothetical protein
MGLTAALGLGAAAVGQVIGAKSQSKAAGKAADVSLAVAEKSNALARENRDMLIPRIDPFVNRGNAAGDTLNALLGLAPAQGPMQGMPAQQPTMQAPMGGTMGGVPPKLPGGWRQDHNGDGQVGFGDIFAWQNGRNNGPLAQVGQTQQGMPQGPQVTQGSAQDAFRSYIDNSDYAFQRGQGLDALNSGWAGAGSLQSGAALKDSISFGKNLDAGYRNEYMNLLGNQQGVGLSGASALAGVGQNYVNTISANNNSAGTAQANALLAKGANNPFALALGTIGGGLFGMGR